MQKDSSNGRRNPKKEICILFLCLMFFSALAPHVSFLENKFIDGDDLIRVVQNPLIRNIRLAGLWHDVVGFFRYHYPSFLLTYFWGWIFHFGGLNHIHFHFVSYLLHAICSSLLYLLLLKKTGRPLISFFSALLFALHPLHCEAVDWICRQDILLIAFLGLIYLHLSPVEKIVHRGVGLTCLFFAVMISPAAVLFVPALYLLSPRRPPRAWVIDGSVALGPAISVWGWKIGISLLHEEVTRAPLSAVVMVKNLIIPWDIGFLLPVFPPGHIPLLILSYSLMIATGLLYLKSHQIHWGFLFLTFFSVSLIHTGSERFNGAWTYLSLLWFSLALGAAAAKWEPMITKRRGAVYICLPLSLILCVTLGSLSIARNMEWTNTATLLKSALRKSPNDPILLAMYGHYQAAMRNPKTVEKVFQTIGDRATITTRCLEAKSYHLLLRFKTSLKIFADLSHHFPFERKTKYCLFDKAVLLNQLGRTAEAEKILKKIVAMDPYFIYAWNDMGALMIHEKKGEKGVPFLRRALEIAPEYRPALENLADYFMKKKAFQKAAALLTIALNSTSCPDTRAFYLEWIRTVRQKRSFKYAALQWAKLTPPG